MSAIETARNNARMVRTALTRETWESINEGWMTLKRVLAAPIDERDLPQVLDAIKRATALIRGSFYGTMLRNEIFDFSQIGTYVERADNTARILDVKYYVLLPSVSWVGSSLDNYQWESILRSVSAHRSYRWVYEADYRPTNIADYLILNGRMPRSLTFCYRFLAEHLRFRDEDYGVRLPCHDTVEKTLAKLRVGSIKQIFDTGLHEFLTGFIQRQLSPRRRSREGLSVSLTGAEGQMRLKISHRTEYHYDEPVHYALQRLRLTPRGGPTQSVLSWAIDVTGAQGGSALHRPVRQRDAAGQRRRRHGFDHRARRRARSRHTTPPACPARIGALRRCGFSSARRR